MAISFDDEKVGNDVGFVWKSMAHYYTLCIWHFTLGPLDLLLSLWQLVMCRHGIFAYASDDEYSRGIIIHGHCLIRRHVLLNTLPVVYPAWHPVTHLCGL